MPTPITWRNVAINSGAGSAGLGNTAANFGRSATQGLSVLNDQLQQRSDTEDERLTNEAISAALSGGPQVSGNRRVDAQALQKSVQSKGLFDETIETSDLTQTGLGLSNELDTFRNENKEAVFDLEKRATELGMDADESTITLNNFKTRVGEYDHERTVQLNALEDTQRANVQALGVKEQSLEDQYAQEILHSTPGANQEQINQARVQARARVQGPEGRQALRQEHQRLGGSEQAWQASAAGRRDGLAEAAEASLQEAAEKRRQVDVENRGQWRVDIDNNNFASSVLGPDGQLASATKAVTDSQKEVISNPGKALQYLNRTGVNINNLDDVDKEYIEEVRAAFPTSSLFGPVVKGYIDAKGNLDRKALRTALSTGQRDILLARANVTAAPPVGGANTSGGAVFPAGDGSGDNVESLVQRFRDVQTRVNNAGNLPANVREMAMKAFEGKVSKGGKSVLDESVRLRNLEEVEDYLDNKNAREASDKQAKLDEEARAQRLRALNKSLNSGQ